MQTPRGFLIGAGVIAAIAAFASVGHPHAGIDVTTTAPEATTTFEAPTTDAGVEVPKHVEASAVEPSTTVELSGRTGDGEGSPGSPTTTVARQIDEDPPRRIAPTTTATAVEAAPASPNTTLAPTTSAPTTTVPASTTTTQPPTTTTSPTTSTTVPPWLVPVVPTVTVPTSPVFTPRPIVIPGPVGVGAATPAKLAG